IRWRAGNRRGGGRRDPGGFDRQRQVGAAFALLLANGQERVIDALWSLGLQRPGYVVTSCHQHHQTHPEKSTHLLCSLYWVMPEKAPGPVSFHIDHASRFCPRPMKLVESFRFGVGINGKVCTSSLNPFRQIHFPGSALLQDGADNESGLPLGI